MLTRRDLLSAGVTCLATASLRGQTRPGGMASRHVTPQRPGQHSSRPFRAKFTDIAASAGLRESSVCGHNDRADYVIEAMGCGVAFVDFDNDGWLDLLVLSGSRFGDPPATASNRLYRNNRNGTFTDVTV